MQHTAVTVSTATPRSTLHLWWGIATPVCAAIALAFALTHDIPGLFEVRRSSAFWTLFDSEEPTAAVLTAILCVAAIAGAATSGRHLKTALDGLARRPAHVCAAFFLGAAAASWFVYQAYPLSMDEYAPWLQAYAFASGKLTGKVPPELVSRIVPAFQGWFIDTATDGRIISVYWPGFALLLAPFAWLRIPWLLNPLIGAATLALLWHLARKLLPAEAHGWVLLFALGSPAFLVNAISYYSMSAHLLFSLSFAALLIDHPGPGRTLLAGVVGSYALVLHNPLPHALFAAPWVIWIARRPRERHLLPLLFGYLPLTLLLGAGWVVLRASIESASPGQHPAVAVSSLTAHLARLAFDVPDLELIGARIAGLTKLMLWAVPGLVPLACAGAVRLRGDRATERQPIRLLAWSGLLMVFGFLFVPYDQGHGWGYRYFHAAWGILPLLAALPLLDGGDVTRLRRAVLVAAAGSLFLAVPLRLVQVHRFIEAQREQIPAVPGDGRQIVFVRADRGFYAQALVQNDPFLRGNRLIFFSRGEAADSRLAAENMAHPRVAARNEVATVWVDE